MKMFGDRFWSKLSIFVAILLMVLSFFNAMRPVGVPYAELDVYESNSSAVVEEGAGSRYTNRVVEDFNNYTMVDRSNTTCSVRSMEGRAYLWGSSPVIPPDYLGTFNQNTHSHGGGYSPKLNEYWYPQWSGTTIYRYDMNHNSQGSFNCGRDDIMQLWGDEDGTYYTTHWGRRYVCKWQERSSSEIWRFDIGSTSASVCCDDTYVYALRWSHNQIRVLRKSDGHNLRNVNLPQSCYSYGSLAYANGLLYVGGYGNDYQRVGIFDVRDFSYIGDFRVQTHIYNMAFNGEEYCISSNSNTVHRYKISDGNAYLGDEIEPPTNITHYQSKIIHKGMATIGAARMTWYEHKPPGPTSSTSSPWTARTG